MDVYRYFTFQSLFFLLTLTKLVEIPTQINKIHVSIINVYILNTHLVIWLRCSVRIHKFEPILSRTRLTRCSFQKFIFFYIMNDAVHVPVHSSPHSFHNLNIIWIADRGAKTIVRVTIKTID